MLTGRELLVPGGIKGPVPGGSGISGLPGGGGGCHGGGSPCKGSGGSPNGGGGGPIAQFGGGCCCCCCGGGCCCISGIGAAVRARGADGLSNRFVEQRL